MKTVLVYTVIAGDSLSAIARDISACAGIGYLQIAAANPTIDSNRLKIGEIIDIPANDLSDHVLRYTIRSGDTLSAIASGLAECAGLTYQQIVANNAGLSADEIKVGQLLDIPASVDVTADVTSEDERLVAAENIGYWDWSWEGGTAPANASMSLAFSGWTDVDTALQQSRQVAAGLVGERYICLGGGNADGAFDSDSLTAITAAIHGDRFSDYDGIAYDVEMGDSGLSEAFAASFGAAKAKGLKVLVTVSHSAPYGIDDAQTLITGFLADEHIDFLSPQLYTSGSETQNDYDISHDVCWTQYVNCKAALVPSIVNASLYADAKRYFANLGICLQGYVQWQQTK